MTVLTVIICALSSADNDVDLGFIRNMPCRVLIATDVTS